MGQHEDELEKARLCFRVGQRLISEKEDFDELPF